MSERYTQEVHPIVEKPRIFECVAFEQKFAQLQTLQQLLGVEDCALPSGIFLPMYADEKFVACLKEAIIADGEIQQTAEHEIGHMDVALALGLAVSEVSVVSDGQSAGSTHIAQKQQLSFKDYLYSF